MCIQTHEKPKQNKKTESLTKIISETADFIIGLFTGLLIYHILIVNNYI